MLNTDSPSFECLYSLIFNTVSPSLHTVSPSQSAVLKDIAILAQEDIELLKIEIQELGPKRITNTTTYKDMTDRYPQFARQIEAEIHEEIWCYNDDYNTI